MTTFMYVLIILSMFAIFLLNMIDVAIIKVSDERIEEEIEEDNKQAIRIQKITNRHSHYQLHKQITVLLLIIVNVIVVFLMFEQTTFLYDEWIALFSLFVIHVVVLNHLARRLGLKYTDNTAHRMAWAFEFIISIFYPISWTINFISKMIAVLFRLNPELTDKDMTEEQIRSLVTESSQKGVLDEDESEMIHNVFEFDETEASEVMTHRTDIEALEVSMTEKEVLKIISTQTFTRYPIYEENLDTIIGTVHLKDFLPYLLGKRKTLKLKSLMRKPYFIPESQNISDLMKEMQQTKNHIAIVLDEYGGTSGLVTFEDVIEELIGNVSDEFDDEDIEIHKLSHDEYHMLGSTNIYDVEDELDIGIDVESYDTLAGFILDQIGHLPQDDAVVSFTFNQTRFEVLSIVDQTIVKVAIKKLTEDQVDD